MRATSSPKSNEWFAAASRAAAGGPIPKGHDMNALDKPTIAVLGTGRMGTPIARNLMTAGYPVGVWNRTAAKARRLGSAGARVFSTPSGAAADADVLITMLADGGSTEHAMTGRFGALESLRPGAIWVQMGTIGLDWTSRLSVLAGSHGVAFVDAPVSGSDGPARDGRLVVLAAADPALRAQLDPMFDVIGRRTVWFDHVGSGTALKLVLNGWLASMVEAAAEGVAFAEALGLDPRVFAETLADLPMGAPYAIAKADAMIAGEFSPGFALRHAFKDVDLAVAAARQRDVSLPLLSVVDGRWGEAVADGGGDEDVASVVKMLGSGGTPAARDGGGLRGEPVVRSIAVENGGLVSAGLAGDQGLRGPARDAAGVA